MKRKPAVGEILYDLNVGNAARNREQKLTPVIVTSVGRKYFTCAKNDRYGFETRYFLKDWSQDSQYTATHRLYETAEEWENEREFNDLYSRFSQLFDRHTGPKLPLSTLRAINEIINAAEQ